MQGRKPYGPDGNLAARFPNYRRPAPSGGRPSWILKQMRIEPDDPAKAPTTPHAYLEIDTRFEK